MTLGGKSLFGNSWVKWLALALLLALLGLGVKAIWFDQKRYLVPASVIPQGSNLALEKWQAVPASLGYLGGGYLAADAKPRGYALATLFPKKFVQLSDIGHYAPQSLARVVVTNKTQLGSGVHSGASVQVWAATKLANNQFDIPKELVESARVARVIKGSAVFGSQNQQVELLIDPSQTAAVILAMSSDSAIFLVATQ
jgi:hypothetical protein